MASSSYQVRSCQSGILYYPLDASLDSAYATCVTQAAAISLLYPNDQLCVIPVGYSVLSARPPLTYQELQALPSASRRQTVLTQQ